MSTQPIISETHTSTPSQVLRPARALLGWMSPEEGCLALASRRIDKASNTEFLTRVTLARSNAARRPKFSDQKELLTEPPRELSEHIAKLQLAEGSAAMFAGGWTVKIADLSKVIGLQPCIYSDHAEERTGKIDSSKMTSIAEISLPLPSHDQVPTQYDEAQQVWLVSSRNPNLKIVGNLAAPVKPGVTAFGFLVSVMPSFVQVALYQGRLVLRDGYHRSLGCLRRGINKVPVFYKEFGQFEDIGIGPGMLPTSSYLGDKPPYLTDYSADDVSADVMLPASQKMVLIHGIETSVLG